MKNVGCAIDFKYMTDYENANFHVLIQAMQA